MPRGMRPSQGCTQVVPQLFVKQHGARPPIVPHQAPLDLKPGVVASRRVVLAADRIDLVDLYRAGALR